ncbi:N-acyl amino acid synthase FeeM domain-containing protein [Thiobacillus sp.]
MIRLHSSRTTRNMPDIPKLPIGIKSRRRDPDEWDKTIVAFQSPYRLRDLCIDQGADPANEETRGGRQEFKVRLATTEDRRKAASLLIEKMYSWRGYEANPLGQDPNKITLVAYQEDKVVGTLTLGLDSPRGMVVDQLYKSEADQLRGQGRKICDVTKLAVDQDIKSKSVLGALFHLSVIYGRNIHHATDFLIEVNPRHALFYQRMIGFVPFGEEKLCSRVNAPAVLLKLDLAYADEQVKEYGGLGAEARGVKSIYPYWFSKEDELGITQRLLRGE